MEEKQFQATSSAPAQEPLKIRTMQDDLKKPPGQSASFISPNQSGPNRGEPPAYLPGVVTIPEPPKPVATPAPPIRQAAPIPPPLPSAPPVFKPASAQPTPQRPLQPAIPPRPAPQPLTPQPTDVPSGLQKKLVIAGVIILIAAAGAFFLWPKEQPPLPPIEPPISLVPADSTSIATIKNEAELTEKLATIITAPQPKETLKYIPVKVTEPKEEFLSLEKFLNILTIGLPDKIAGQTDGKYSLFSFSQAQPASAETENRFVLVLSLSSPIAGQDLKDWEPRMFQDLELLYSSLPDNLPNQIKFANSERKDASGRRFVNFGSPDLSLDYAMAKNMLIFSTSKQSMDKILDLINK